VEPVVPPLVWDAPPVDESAGPEPAPLEQAPTASKVAVAAHKLTWGRRISEHAKVRRGQRIGKEAYSEGRKAGPDGGSAHAAGRR
jgi:Flp pilus assembly protein CpaB